MRAIYTQAIVSMSPTSQTGGGTCYDSCAAVLSLCDDGGGVYLMVRGRSDDETDEDLARSFPLCTADDIDQFAAICKAMLAQGETE